MEREILFRGKSVNTGKWLYGHLFNYGLTAPSNVPCICVCVPTSWEEAYNLYAVHPDTIGQYTGMKDKNKKKIFDGDILKFIAPDGTIRYFVVEWASEDRILRPLSDFVPDGNPVRFSGWCFNWRGYRLYPTVIDGVPDNEVMEIVGNIHDNPELIKKNMEKEKSLRREYAIPVHLNHVEVIDCSYLYNMKSKSRAGSTPYASKRKKKRKK